MEMYREMLQGYSIGKLVNKWVKKSTLPGDMKILAVDNIAEARRGIQLWQKDDRTAEFDMRAMQCQWYLVQGMTLVLRYSVDSMNDLGSYRLFAMLTRDVF